MFEFDTIVLKKYKLLVIEIYSSSVAYYYDCSTS